MYDFSVPWFCSQIPRGSDIVDIGCGTGHFSKQLIKETQPRNYYAIDNDPIVVAKWKGHDFGSITNASVCEKDAEDINLLSDLKIKGPHVFIIRNTMHHFKDKKLFLERLKSYVTKEGGSVLLMDVDYQGNYALGGLITLVTLFRNVRTTGLMQSISILLNSGCFLRPRILRHRMADKKLLKKQKWYIYSDVQKNITDIFPDSKITRDGGISSLGGAYMMAYTSDSTREKLRIQGAIKPQAIATNALCFTYDGDPGKTILRNLTCEVESGKISVILGKSGCGKSTLLKIFAGIEDSVTPKNCVSINGRSAFFSQSLHEIAYLPQEFSPPSWRTCIENLELALMLSNVANKNERLDLAQDFLSKLGLSEYANHYPDQLSGGQKRRISIAMCLIMRPTILFLDEPFTGLDISTKYDLYGFIINLWESSNLHNRLWNPENKTYEKTIILVTHDIIEALLLSDIIYILPKHTPVTSIKKIINPVGRINSFDEIQKKLSTDKLLVAQNEILNLINN